MEFFPSALSAKASDALLERLMAHQTREGFGVWPLEIGVGPHKPLRQRARTRDRLPEQAKRIMYGRDSWGCCEYGRICRSPRPWK